jgi:hypothetical protein
MRKMNYKPEIFQFYFYFIQERMRIFWDRIEGKKMPWTEDNILREYRFTNVYRASDRVSQYLIRNVIYSSLDLSPEDIALRIIVFKIFNKIETWEYLENMAGPISTKNFKVERISKALEERRKYAPIFNNAYMMTGTHSRYNHLKFKHEKWLSMVDTELIGNSVLLNVLRSRSLEEIYCQLRGCSFLGDFLAYQYAIDLNYSPIFRFDENSFVKAGVGAIRGIRKCFKDLGTKDYESVIYFTLNNFQELQRKFGYVEFQPLCTRQPTLIDLQNCFCETDKYLRAKRPELLIDNVRIKQRFKPKDSAYALFFPPFWNLKCGEIQCK